MLAPPSGMTKFIFLAAELELITVQVRHQNNLFMNLIRLLKSLKNSRIYQKRNKLVELLLMASSTFSEVIRQKQTELTKIFILITLNLKPGN